MSLIHDGDVFWIVARLDGGGSPPRKKHATLNEALEEAQRLAQIERGIEFFALKATDSWRTPKEVSLIHTKFARSED